MHRYLFIPILLCTLYACSNNTDDPGTSSSETSVTVKQLWQIEGLAGPESVVVDPDQTVLYVSNVNGGPTDKDNNGFISIVSMDGKLLDLNWVTGMNAPKGLALHGTKLYVSDIDTLHVIDTKQGTISQSFTTEDAKFLNDVTVTNDGKVYVSDMLTNRIYCLDGDTFDVWLEDDGLTAPNGLHAEADHLVVGSWGVMTDGFATDVPGHLKTVQLNDKSIQSLGDGTAVGNLDGVEPYGDNYLVTDWMAGKLYNIEKSGNATLLLELEQGMADLEYLPEQQLILLPMMLNDKLLAYSLADWYR